MKTKKIIIAVVAIILGIFIIYKIIKKYKNESYITSNIAIQPYLKNLKENFTVNDFTIHNHLNVDITIQVNRLSKDIKAHSTVTLTPNEVATNFSNGSEIEIYINGGRFKYDKYSNYVIDMPYDNLRIKNLHIGMITDRSIGPTDSFRSTVTSANAIQGQTHVYIHNLSALPLNLQVGSTNFTIDPYQVYTYKGYLHSGVALGTIFKNVNGLYDDYVYLKPFSNIYYGLTSDKQQPAPGQGCNQYSFYDECQRGQTLWPFQDGIY